MPNVGFYSLPRMIGRIGRFIYDATNQFLLQHKSKKHEHCAKTQHCFGRSRSLPPVGRPPTASQWAAVRIKTYIGDIRNQFLDLTSILP